MVTGTTRRASAHGARPKAWHSLACRPKAVWQAVGLSRLDLDLDVDPGGKIEPLQRVHRLRRVLDDVDEALVNAHLEMLTAVLVLVRRADDRVAVHLGRKRDGTAHLCLGAEHRLDDLLRRLVDDLVVVCLQTDADPLPGALCHIASLYLRIF